MVFRQLFDAQSCAYTYLVADLNNKQAAIVDPVLRRLDRDLNVLRELGVTLTHCFETHLHDDHVSAAGYLREATGCQIVVPKDSNIDYADRMLADGECVLLGDISIQAIATPGHTRAHYAYLINHDRVLTGDSLAIRSCGHTNSADSDPGELWNSVHNRLFTLAEETLVYPGHDFQGRSCSTIKEELEYNPRLSLKSKAQFIEHMDCLGLPKVKNFAEIISKNKSCGEQEYFGHAM
jgi:sulfur dioxygenase